MGNDDSANNSERTRKSDGKGVLKRIGRAILSLAALAQLIALTSVYLDLQESRQVQTRIAEDRGTEEAQAAVVREKATQDARANATFEAISKAQLELFIDFVTKQAMGVDPEDAQVYQVAATALQLEREAIAATQERTLPESVAITILESTPTPTHTPTPSSTPTPAFTLTPTSTPTPTITPTPTPTPTSPPEPGTLLFSDDFESGFDSDTWEIVSGLPFVANGRLTSNGGMWIVTEVGWPNYTISFDVGSTACRPGAANTEDWVRLLVRYEDRDNHLILYTGCNLRWINRINGNGQDVSHSASSLPPKIEGRLYIEASVQGNQFEAKDGVRLFLDNVGSGTKVGIRTEGNQTIDNFTVIALP